jgi:type IV secretory pathway TrbD component
MTLLFAIPSFLFLGGLGVMMWVEAKSTRRNENERDPIFVRRSR